MFIGYFNFLRSKIYRIKTKGTYNMDHMTQILNFNKQFVEEKKYEKYITSKYPDSKIAILSCMDTRLIELLPAALGLKNGDAILIKNAGGIVTHPFGSVMRSLVISIYELGVEEIMVIGHTDCGVQNLNAKKLIDSMIARGVSEASIEMMKYCGLDTMLRGFSDVYESVQKTTELIRRHPLIPQDIHLHGFVMDSVTGSLIQAI